MASTDTHIKFTGVTGESTHKDHKGEIEVLSWVWGVNNSGGGTSGGSGKGKAIPGEFQFTHRYDKSSPILAKYCASGKHFAEVVLTACKSGDGQVPFLRTTFSEAFVISVQPSGNIGAEITERVVFSYKKVEFAYKAQDEKGGMTGEVKFAWDVPAALVS